MKLSIVIPVYDWDTTALVEALAREILSGGAGCPVEIVAFDDCSTDPSAKEANRIAFRKAAADGIDCRYEEQPINRGRAGIRNLLFKASTGTHLLLLDSDVLPDTGDFLSRYVKAAESTGADVLCGGHGYSQRIMPGREYDFHVCYSGSSEWLPAEERNREPWRYVFTSNMLVRREALEAVPFDDRFTGYGYEDTEWGIRLARTFKVVHIDNTVSHLGLIPKLVLFRRMRGSVANYRLLADIHPGSFKGTRVYPYAAMFSKLPWFMLSAADGILEFLLSLQDRSQRFNLIVFQLDKAVLLARELKKK